jgi:hypothetical protein
VAAGGPIADLLGLLLIGLPVLVALRGPRPPGLSWGLELLAMIAINEGSSCLNDAIPRRRDGRFNDGAKVLWRAARQSVAVTGRSPYDVWHDAGRRSNAGDAQLLLAVHLARGGRFAEAVEQVSGLQPASGRVEQAVRETAVADLVLSDSVVNGVALDPARLASLRKVIDPDQEPAVRHTYALWLLASGQPASAAVEAQQALLEAEGLEPVARASVCATVVIALAEAGDHSQARSWYDQVPHWSPWRPAAARSLGL